MAKYLSRLLIKLIKHFKTVDGDFIRYGNQEVWQKNGFSIVPNHYYSPIPDLSLLKKDSFTKESNLPGINLNIDQEVLLLKNLSKFSKELNKFTYLTRDIDNQKDPKFYFGNMAFDNVDACIYYCLIRSLKPKLIIEIGSGWSTKIAASASQANKNTKIISIEPYPQPILRKGFPGLSKLIEQKIQDVPVNFFSKLSKNDILFIDSSHTVKSQGDVNYLVLEVLPRLKKGVWVHIHDIFLPWDYPMSWVTKEYRFWNEQYIIQAFLVFNNHYQIALANHYLCRKNPKLIKKIFPMLREFSGGSLWCRKVK